MEEKKASANGESKRGQKIEVGVDNKKQKSLLQVERRYGGNGWTPPYVIDDPDRPGRKMPRRIYVYDSGPALYDRYTVTFPGVKGAFPYLGITEGGSYNHGDHDNRIDVPAYSHLGKKIKFADLPTCVQKVILWDYADWWELPIEWLTRDCLNASEGLKEDK